MSFSTEQWKTHQKNASRACFITIKNTTAVTLVRTNYHLQSGIWSCFPPEKISPSTLVEFGSQSTGLMSGTDGYVQYKCSTEEEPFTFAWLNSWWGTRKMSHSCPPKYKCLETGTLNNFAEMHWVVTYNENYPKIASLDNSFRITPTAGQQLNTLEKSQISKDIEWQNELAKAQRSVTVTIENKTRWVLKRRDQRIIQGIWALFPAEVIPPNQSTTFATLSHGWMTGTEGKLYYSIPGIKGDLIFYWCNLWIGDKVFKARGPPNVYIENTAIKSNQAKVTFYILQNETEKEGESVSNGGTVESSPIPFKPSETNSTIKLLTFNTQLLPALISQNKPEQRAIGIADFIIRRKYDIVCLQEVFAQGSRNELVKRLKDEYPYMVVRSGGQLLGEGSGLFVASKLPILKYKFYPFNNGIGSDAWCQKGLLSIKFDLSALVPNRSLFVHTTHLQSNPDGSLPWLLSGVGIEKAIEVREEQLKMIRKILDTCITNEQENGQSLENISMILCGDFHIVAEQEMKSSSQSHVANCSTTLSTNALVSSLPNTEEKILVQERNKEQLSATNDESSDKSLSTLVNVTSALRTETDTFSKLPRSCLSPSENAEFYLEVIKSLADSINRREIKLISASDIVELFHKNEIPLELLGKMRRHIAATLLRERLLILIEMICFTIRNEIIEKLTKLKVVDENIATSENFYCEIVLYYFSLLLAPPNVSNTNVLTATTTMTATTTTTATAPTNVSTSPRSKSTHFSSPMTILGGIPSTTTANILSSNTNNSNNNNTNQTSVIIKEKEMLATIKYYEGEEENPENFWKNVLLDKLIVTFPEGLTEEEKTVTFNLQSHVLVLKYQLLRSLERMSGVSLTADAWTKCIKQNYFTFSVNDIISTDFTNPQIPFNVIKTQTNSKNVIDTTTSDELLFSNLQLIKTPEYEKALKILDNPRDIYREMNADFPGYTVNSYENKLEKSKGSKIRIDYIFSYDSISRKKLQLLECLECMPAPFSARA